MRKMIIVPTLLVLAACAKPPEEIVAAAVPQDRFMQRGCDELATLADAKRKNLSEMEEQQRAVAKEDRDSMWAVHVPVGSLRGKDRADEIALIKGEVRSIADAQRAKGCS